MDVRAKEITRDREGHYITIKNQPTKKIKQS